MGKLKNILPSSVLLTLYYSLILPHLSYGLLVWGTQCGKLFKLQKRSVRLIINAKYNSHTILIFRELQLLKIHDLHSLQELKFIYKLEKRLLPTYFMSKLYLRHSDRHTYGTRFANNVETIACRHAFTKNSICYHIPDVINNCPMSIKAKIHTHSISGYIKYIKAFYFKNYPTQCFIIDCYICKNST